MAGRTFDWKDNTSTVAAEFPEELVEKHDTMDTMNHSEILLILILPLTVKAQTNLQKNRRRFVASGSSSYVSSNLFKEPLYYDVRHDLPEDIIRNKRDSRFFPGIRPAGVRGITKKLLHFIERNVNPLGFIVHGKGKSEERNEFGDGYEEIEYSVDNSLEENSGFFLDFTDE